MFFTNEFFLIIFSKESKLNTVFLPYQRKNVRFFNLENNHYFFHKFLYLIENKSQNLINNHSVLHRPQSYHIDQHIGLLSILKFITKLAWKYQLRISLRYIFYLKMWKLFLRRLFVFEENLFSTYKFHTFRNSHSIWIWIKRNPLKNWFHFI